MGQDASLEPMRVDHTSIWVSDLERTKELFEEIMDMVEIWGHEYVDETQEIFLGRGNGATFQVMYRPGSDVHPEPENYDRFVVAVDDPDRAQERARAADDCSVFNGPSAGSGDDQSFAFRGPDGYQFEVVGDG